MAGIRTEAAAGGGTDETIGALDNSLEIEIDLGGGAGETQTVSADGGTIQFTVDGQPVELNLDCSQEWLVCPSEVWTEEVEFDQPRFACFFPSGRRADNSGWRAQPIESR